VKKLGIGLGIGGRAELGYAANLLNGATYLNDTSPTFTRATSAYDPIANAIVGAGVRRRRGCSVGLRTLSMDLIEGSRTNLLAAGTSEHFELATWAKTACSVTTGSTAPDGTATACKLIEDSSSGLHVIKQTVTKGASAIAYSFALIIKASERPGVQIVLSNAAVTAFVQCRYNASTGATVGLTTSGFTASSANIESIGGGLYRCTLMATSDTDTSLIVHIRTDNGSTANYQGDGASGVIIYGADLQAAAFPSSYISNRNLLLQTEAFSTTWTKTDITVTSDSTANPIDGALTADTLTQGTAGTARLAQSSPATVISGATFTYSGYIFRGNNTVHFLQMCNGASTSGINAWVNLSTGAVLTTTAFGTGSITSVTMTAVTGQSGWYRFAITGTIGAFTAIQCVNFSVNADNSTTRINNSTVILYGIQLEYGTAATTYWANTTAVGLRAADVLFSTNALSTTAGTNLALLIPYGWTGDQDGSTNFRYMLDGDASADSSGQRNNATTLLITRADAGGSNGLTPTHGLTNGTLRHIANTWTTSAHTAYINGVSAAAATPGGGAFNAVAVLYIGSHANGTAQFYGWVGIPYWDRALIAGELLALSTAATA
jgi:hypothetical protein